MAFPNLLFLVSLIIFVRFTLADAIPHSHDAAAAEDDPISSSEAAELQLHRLMSKISSLETSIEDQTGELRRKDGGIKHLQKLIEEKSTILTSLQTKLQSFQESLKPKQIEKVKTRVDELEKQVVNIKKEIEAQKKKKDTLETRAYVAEKKIEELNLKLQTLQRINDEQKSRIHKAQRALQVAEEEMLKAKLEASTITEQLKEVNEAWLPPWLSAHLFYCQSFILTHWNEIGWPATDQSIQKALELKYGIEKWVQHYLDIMKSVITKWLPTINEQYSIIVDDFYPLVQSLSAQAIDYYHLAKNTIKPYLVNIIESVSPYFQETKMFMMSYIDQVSEITKPHLAQVKLFLKPYSKQMLHYHKRITKNVQTYHSLIQATLHEMLSIYELTQPFATEELVRFMASVLMALPVFVLFRMLPMREPKKCRRSTSKTHNRRRAKKVHRDF